MANKNPIIKIKAKAMWANVFTPNEMSGKYQLDLCELSNSAVAALEDMGLSVRQDANKPEKGFFITAKSKFPITTVDKNGNDLNGTLIGNGSELTASVSYFDWKFKNKTGRSASPVKLVVDKLVAYSADDEKEEEDSLDDIL